MKKLIPIFLAVLCLTACGNEQVKNPDTLSTAVISSSDSVTAKNTLNSLNESTVATLTADKIDASNIGDLSDYDVLYIDKSVVETGGFNASAVEEYVSNGGSVFLDNDVYNVFDKDFIGAEDFVTIDSCPVDMIYPENSDKGIKKIQSLLSDFSMLYRNYADYNDVLVNQNYGVGVVPSTAECVASKDNVGIYTVNQYGNGYVFFTNPLLPNSFSVTIFLPMIPANTFQQQRSVQINCSEIILRNLFRLKITDMPLNTFWAALQSLLPRGSFTMRILRVWITARRKFLRKCVKDTVKYRHSRLQEIRIFGLDVPKV